jgi:hypothetical protein
MADDGRRRRRSPRSISHTCPSFGISGRVGSVITAYSLRSNSIGAGFRSLPPAPAQTFPFEPWKGSAILRDATPGEDAPLTLR